MPTVAMCAPHEFRVGSPINPWMQSASLVDSALASTQWRQLANTYAALGVDVVAVDAEAGLSDMVFAADAGLLADGAVVPSVFRYGERRREERHWREFFRGLGLELLSLPPGVCFEGGDAVRFGDTLFLGHGFRTDRRAAPLLEERAQVVRVPLVDPRFFHLDTCCGALDEQTMLLAQRTGSCSPPSAFPPVIPHREALGTVETAAMAAELALSSVNERRLGPLRHALEDGRPGRLFTSAKWAVRGGLALRFASRVGGPWVHHLASALYLLAGLGVPLRLGGRGARVRAGSRSRGGGRTPMNELDSPGSPPDHARRTRAGRFPDVMFARATCR
jgi:N-dimethylarginine dimethylaminohydrolase